MAHDWQEKAFSILEDLPDGVLVFEEDEILWVNRKAREILGRPLHEVKLSDFRPDDCPGLIALDRGAKAAVQLELRWRLVEFGSRNLGLVFMRRCSQMPSPGADSLREFEERALQSEQRAQLADQRFRSLYEKSGGAADLLDEAEQRARQSEEASVEAKTRLSEAEARMAQAIKRAEAAEQSAAQAEQRSLEANIRFRRIYEMSGVGELERKAADAQERAAEAEHKAELATKLLLEAEDKARSAIERAERAEQRYHQATERFEHLYQGAGPAASEFKELVARNSELEERTTAAEREARRCVEELRRATTVADAARWKIKRMEDEVEEARRARERAELGMREAVERARLLEEHTSEETDGLNRLAFEDRVTGLAEQDMVLKLLERRLNDGKHAAVLLLDLDRFRVVNDTLGRAAGDQVLRVIAERLKVSVGGEDLLGRADEDVFMVAISRDHPEQLSAAVDDLRSRLALRLPEPIEAAGQKVAVSAGMGVAWMGRSATQLFQAAKLAVSEAKLTGPGGFAVYSPELNRKYSERRRLEKELLEALKQQQFALFYQPIFELESQAVVGLEALLRWRHPRRGLLIPKDFLNNAIDAGLIVPLGEWVLECACRMAQELPDEQYISVNISPRQLLQVGFAERVGSALRKTSLDPEKLVIEFPEGLPSISPDLLGSVLEKLARQGVGMAVDDFGSGSSSVRQLQDYNVRFLKIDRNLVNEVPQDEAASDMCRAIIGMARTLGIRCLAEGVETEDQRDFLLAAGCDLGQGYLFSEPMSEFDVPNLFLPSFPGTPP